MDIGDIIKDYFWVIIAVLFYLIAGRKKKKPQKQEDPSVKISAPQAPAKGGLQERLEQALREMQERVEQESGTSPARKPVPSPSPQPTPSPAAIAVPSQAPVSNSIGEEGVPFETVPARDPFAFASATPLHQRKTALDIAFGSEQKMNAEKSERFSGFREGHGLRYHTHSGEIPPSGTTEFHEAHGLHYGQLSHQRKGGMTGEDDISSLFKSEEEVRRAIIAAEILGPPKGRH